MHMSQQVHDAPAARPARIAAALVLSRAESTAANSSYSEDGLRLMELEARAARACMADMKALEREHPAWLAQFDDVNPDVADMDELIELLDSAPTAFARGIVKGRIDLRLQVASVTLRA
jgi:hypothetical protein